MIGLAVIWGLGALAQLQQPIESGSDLVLALGRWWGGTLISSLWWPGALVAWFATASWVRRRWPSTGEWQPRAKDRITGGRAALLMGMFGIVLGLCILFEPRGLLNLFWARGAAPAAVDALTYTEAFRQRQGTWLFVLLLLNIPIMVGVFIRGHWTPGLRRLDLALGLLVCAVMAWTVLDGPVFVTAVSDQTIKAVMLIIIVCALVARGIQYYRSVTPMPDTPVQAQGSH